MAFSENAISARAEKVLSKKYRYQEGILTRKEFIELNHERGARVEEGTTNRMKWDRRKSNRLKWEEQVAYDKKCDEMVPEYRIYRKGDDNSFSVITLTEFNYFNSL